MGKKIMQTAFKNKFNWFLFAALLFTSFLVPNLPLVENFPKIHPTDILLPFFLIAILFQFNSLAIVVSKKYLLALALLILVALLSLIVNKRLLMLRDDFEVMKFFKYIIVFLFVVTFAGNYNFSRLLKVVFVLVLLFNFLHYIDFLGFNRFVVKYYGSDAQVSGFGLNSLGQPDTKRIIGTVGNPNNNAILFLFFVVFFFPENKSGIKEKIFFLLAVFGMFACQSRTGFIAFGIIFILGSIIKKYPVKMIAIYLLSFAGMFFGLMLLGNIYLNSLGGDPFKQHSVTSRLETWKKLWAMIKQKPALGYSPYKEYFEENHIYSESEYFLFAWRFGLIGLAAYLYMLFSAFIASWSSRFSENGFRLSMYTIVIAVTALTNNPLTDPMIYMMYAFCAGLFFSDKLKERRIVT